MDEGRITRSALQDDILRGQEMKTPDDVAAEGVRLGYQADRGWAAAITR